MAKVLDRVNVPADLKALSVDELNRLAQDIRELILETVSRTGGHLAANLGVVELTLALLRTFDPPADKLVWDVGHQTYAYKILTGRKDRFATLRQFGGLSGFQRRDESRYDAYGAGHSGTALSAALGMAVARDLRGGAEHVVAILGDGAAGCGISLEAFNNVQTGTQRLIVVLNDNEMSIAQNVGALSRYLGKLLASPRYNRWKRSVETVGTRLRMHPLRSAYFRIEEAVKSIFLRSVMFEEFGLRYVGPIDGHSIPALLDALSIAREASQPILLHISTQKGRGYPFAEQFPEKWHGTAGFDIKSGEAVAAEEGPTYSASFGAALEDLASRDERIVAITAAMRSGTGLARFAERFPRRFFDVGISEEHAVVFAAGLAAQGLRPVVAMYSTFSQRVVDCMIHDVCLQNLPVLLCLDRAGVVGDDGPTHHGVFDIALLRPVPRLVIMQPKDEAELAHMLYTAIRMDGPAVIRYPRGVGSGARRAAEYESLPLGKAETLSEGEQVRIWALGDMVHTALQTAALLETRGVSAGVVNARFVRPLDEELLLRQAASARVVATIENGIVTGGFGSGVEALLVQNGFRGRILRFGWPDRFVPQGNTATLMHEYGLTPDAIAEQIAGACRPSGV